MSKFINGKFYKTKGGWPARIVSDPSKENDPEGKGSTALHVLHYTNGKVPFCTVAIHDPDTGLIQSWKDISSNEPLESFYFCNARHLYPHFGWFSADLTEEECSL